MLTGLLVTNLWAAWRLSDILLQMRSGNDRVSNRAEQVVADLKAGRIQVVPSQKTRGVTVLVESVSAERKYQTTLLQEWSDQSHSMFLWSIFVFVLQLVAAVALPIIGERRSRRLGAAA